MTTKQTGEIYRVSGPVVTAIGIQPRMYDIVRVGEERLMGEVIEIEEDRSIIQVYEDTSGIRPGEPVINTGLPLTVELGPGLLTSIYDGIQRPLPILRDEMGDFIERGVDAPGLDHEKKWEFTPTVKPGDEVAGGSVIGTVPETPTIEHKILVPPKQKPTKVKSIEAGSFTIDETVCVLEDGTELMLHHRWPVREARPSQEKLLPDVPLNTGQRILDGLFPLAKGGTAAIPGPFGSGKCVAGDTPVLLADGRRVAIEELYESLAQGDAGESAEHLEVLETPLRVVGFDGQRLTRADATQVYRGTTDRILRITTRTGRAVEVTPAHKLFRAHDGRIEETLAARLEAGDELVVPRGAALANVLESFDSAASNAAEADVDSYLAVAEPTQNDKRGVSPQSASNQGEMVVLERVLDHVFFDAIVDIEVVEGVRPVYDLVVPETQNFVGGHQPFLLHNTVTQQALAKWSDAQVVVYIGCGERGNEMTEVLTEFPELEDPKSGNPLMDRTVLIANTSNMPVAAREASVYTGVTIAEYYRDQGYDVSLMADSTSRWAEAMREISSRLEEMPGEEGYPAYLAARLSQFYERAGRVVSNAGPEGSVSIIGAVSPPGGDFSEPVTQNTLRIVKVFWALDSKLAQKRHFPAINWLQSYSLYSQSLAPWYSENVAEDWNERRGEAMDILQKESELQEIVQLVGSDALPEPEQLTIEVARMLREIFLQQNAFHDVDTYSPLKKQYDILTTILDYDDLARKTLDAGGSVQDITSIKAREDLARSKFEKDFDGLIGKIREDIKKQLEALTSTTQEVTA